MRPPTSLARAPRRRPTRFGALVAAWAAIAVVLVAALLVAWHQTSRERVAADRNAARAVQILGDVALVERRTIDLETGLRGYSLTGDRAFLAPYDAAERALPADLAAMRRRIIDPEAARLAAELESRISAYLRDYAAPLIQARPRTGEGLRRSTTQGKLRMDALRRDAEALRERQRDVLAVRRARSETDAARARYAGIALSVGVVLAILALVAAMLRGVVRPVRRLTEATQRESRKRAEEQRDFLDAVLSQLDEGILACDADGRLTLANHAARTLLGLAPDTLLDDAEIRAGVQLLASDARTPLAPEEYPLARTLREGEVRALDCFVLTATGRLRRVTCSGRALRDEAGTVVGAVVALRDVTSERAVADALRASEQRHRAVLESVGEIVFETDAHGRWTFLSPLWTEATGQLLGDTLGEPVVDHVHPEDRNHFLTSLREILSQRLGSARLQYRYIGRGGAVRWADVKVRLGYDDDGRLTGTLGTVQDMTDRVLAADALERLQLQHTWILESAGEGILGVDARGHVTFANGASARMTGWAAEELQARSLHDCVVVDADGAPLPWKGSPLHHALTRGEARAGDDVWFRHRDGSIFPVSYTASPILEDGTVSGGVVVFRDISEQHRTTLALEGEREFQRALLHSLHDGIVACDAEGTITLFNRASRHVLGVETDGTVLLDAAGTTPLADDELPIARALRGEDVRDTEITVGRPGHPERSLLASGRAIHDATGRKLGAVIATHDITERRRAERLKDEFLALVSHELRTPLTSIVGYVETLLEDGEDADPATRERFLAIVHRNGVRLQRLVSDLLFVAQLESGALTLDIREADVATTIEQAVEAAALRASRRGVGLATDVASPLLVKGDRDRLGQAIDNLLSNAIKYTPEGGSIEVRARMADDGRTVAVEVADSGIGLSPEDAERVFDRFFRADAATARQIPGVGLGLAIVKAIVDSHGGRVDVAATEGAGCIFRLRLPAAPRGADASPTAPPPTPTEIAL